ncbi:hypothetical protein RhiirA4_413318 [Rhizophagus irregularis]|uniref:Uncharacterized protein n=1 Tax=Rhizophagus irregularis TaxID=588596 RepID=A0A2I1FSR0_9GLOM|nr:hypothetical protein RhiirA4_413318 [Rhizophagus irregularis]
MPISLNTFILGGTTDEIFVTVLDDVVLINDFKININALKISNTRKRLKIRYYSLQHGFYLLLGHRQGGKTTIAMGLKRWLEDNSSYVVYYLNFNTGITTKKDIYEFWRLYNESKDVVLIMDDVSILNYKSESEKLIIDNFIAMLKELKEQRSGLVGICCHYFATNLMVGTNEANLCDWEKHTLIQLPQYIKEQATYKSIIRCLKDLNGNEIEILTECAAPILRNIMLSRIHRPTIKHSSPIDTTNIDPEWLLARTIENMSIQDISHKYTFNANNQPSEYAFQAEFLGIFKQLISTAYPHLFFLRKIQQCDPIHVICDMKDGKTALVSEKGEKVVSLLI